MRFPAPPSLLSPVLLALALACSGRAGEAATAAAPSSRAADGYELEIPIFAGGLGADFFVETARLFESARPGIRVNLYGEPRMHDKMRVRVLNGDFPDATYTELPWVNLIRVGRVVDLTDFLDGPNWEGDARWRDTFLPGVLETWTIEGRVYGLPLEQSCWTLFYDKRLFRQHGWEPPRTWDEFFALCERIHGQGLAPLALPGVYLRYGDAILRAAVSPGPRPGLPTTGSIPAGARIRVLCGRPLFSSASPATTWSLAGRA